MNAKTKNFMTRLLFSLLLSTGLLTATAQPTAAHKVEYRPVVSNHYHYRQGAHGRRFMFPRWLREKQDFQRWYISSVFCCNRGHNRSANWNRLYEMYTHERRQHRRNHKRFQGKVYIDLNRPSRRRNH
jgi:hypothetical protein